MRDRYRRGLAWRIAVAVALTMFVILWRACLKGPEYVVQIYSGRDALIGAEVVIDGQVAGVLGQGNRGVPESFPVDEGDHTLELRMQGCESERARFSAGFGGARVMFAWYRDVSMQRGDSVCVLRRER